jgi:hypothetical protein
MIPKASEELLSIWLKSVGVLLILLGLTLFVSPYVSHTTKEPLRNAFLTVK